MYPKTVKAVVTSFVTTSEKKPGVALTVIDGTTITTDELIFTRKRMAGVNIGGIYEFEQISETSFAIGSRTYKGIYPDDEQIARWQLAAKAQTVREEVAYAEKKDGQRDMISEALTPIRDVYRRALPSRKLAIEIIVLEYLRRQS